MSGLFQASWLPVAGWALLHSLWEGALVALAAALTLRCLRGFSPRARYAVAVLALLLMAALPLLHLFPARGEAGLPFLHVPPRSAGAGVHPVPAWGTARLDGILPWVVAAWATGALCGLLRLAGGWVWLQRLRWGRARLAPDSLQRRLLDLCRRAGLKRAVTLLVCEGLAGPSVVGVLRPAILVPAGWFLNLPPDHVEALLAHELAHVLRHDYAVNLLQGLVEVLMFYHPGVWWLSRRIREERELACDGYAANLLGDPLPLAEAVAALERRGPAPSRLAPAAQGGSLMERISHLLLPPRRTFSAPAFGAMVAAVLILASGLGLAARTSEPGFVRVAMARAPSSEDAVIVSADILDPDTGKLAFAPRVLVKKGEVGKTSNGNSEASAIFRIDLDGTGTAGTWTVTFSKEGQATRIWTGKASL